MDLVKVAQGNLEVGWLGRLLERAVGTAGMGLRVGLIYKQESNKSAENKGGVSAHFCIRVCIIKM
jgi:hypothetical protein